MRQLGCGRFSLAGLLLLLRFVGRAGPTTASSSSGSTVCRTRRFERIQNRELPQPELAAAAADDEPLDPASGAAGLDEQVQAVAVGVPSWRCGADEGGRAGWIRQDALGWFAGGH